MNFLKLAISAALFVSTTIVYASDDVCSQRHCMMVVDAGSSGSRVHLYAYDEDAQQSPINISELYTKKITPGFATLDAKMDDVYNYLDKLLLGTPANNVPVYFYATAGMRLIPNQQQQELYRLLKQWFWTEPQWQLQEARTISGSEEGVYGWLGTNYFLHTFDTKDKTPVGFIEVGGASVQLVLPVDDLTDIQRQDIVRVMAYGQQFLVYAHSFLGAGVGEVIKQVPNTPACYPNHYSLPNGEQAQGDAVQCAKSITQVIDADSAISASAKSATKNNHPAAWYITGAPTYLTKQSQTYFQDHQLSPQSLLDFANTAYCQQEWSVLQTLYPNDTYMSQYCVSGALFHSLAVDSFGLNPEQALQTLTEDKSPDWTMGVVIQHVSE